MEQYIIKIHKHKPKSTKIINLPTTDFLQSHYEGIAYDLANTLTELYEKYNNESLIIKIQNVKNEPIKPALLNGVQIFRKRCHLV